MFLFLTRHFAGRRAEAFVGDAIASLAASPSDGLSATASSLWPTPVSARRPRSFLVPPHDPTFVQLRDIAGPLIRAKVQRLIAKAGLHQQDHLDLMQEVWTRLWPRLRAYDPHKGQLQGFLATTIDRIVANLLRDRFAAKRDFRRLVSLQQRVRTEEGSVELGQTLCSPKQDAGQERADLALDVADAIAQLPEDKRELVQLLQHQNLTEIARRLGVPRSPLQGRIRQVWQLFDHAGLREYL